MENDIKNNSGKLSTSIGEIRRNSQTWKGFTNLTENDDKREKEDRRKSRARQSLSRSKEAPSIDFEKLKSLYSECIRLSSENRINDNNAFGLELIDYMGQVLNQNQDTPQNDFQVASCTLDAGMKIYCHRVDSVHLDVFKMIDKFNNTQENDSFNQEDIPENKQDKNYTNNKIHDLVGDLSENENDYEKQFQEIGEKENYIMEDRNLNKNLALKNAKSSNNQHQSKIETNLKNIQLDKFELDEESDLWNRLAAKQSVCKTYGRGGPFSYACVLLQSQSDFGILKIGIKDNKITEKEIESDKNINFCATLRDCLVSDIKEFHGDFDTRLTDFAFENWSLPILKHYKRKDIKSIIFNQNVPETTDSNSFREDYHVEPIIDANFNQEIDLSISDHNVSHSQESELSLKKILSNNDAGDDFMNALAILPSEYSYFSGNHPHLIKEFEQNRQIKDMDFLEKIRCKSSYIGSKSVLRSKKPIKTFDFNHDFCESDRNLLKSMSKSSKSHFMSKSPVSMIDDDNNNPTLPEIDISCLFRLFLLSPDYFKQTDILKVKKTDLCQNEFPYDQDGSEHWDAADYDPSRYLDLTLIDQPLIAEAIEVEYAKSITKIDTKIIKNSIVSILSDIKSKNDGNTVSKSIEFLDLHDKITSNIPNQANTHLSLQLSFFCLLHIANDKNLNLFNTPSKDIQIDFNLSSF